MAEAPVRRLVLLVDATEDTRDLGYGDWFFIRGFDVVATARDDIALLIAKAYRPDLVVTDLHAKGLDGLRLVQRIRSEADICEIPILIMTVVTDPPLFVSLRAQAQKLCRSSAISTYWSGLSRRCLRSRAQRIASDVDDRWDYPG